MKGPSEFSTTYAGMVGDMNLVEVLVYLDNIIVFGETLEQHKRLEKVLTRFHEEGLNLSKRKANSTNHLSHTLITLSPQKGYQPTPRSLRPLSPGPDFKMWLT